MVELTSKSPVSAVDPVVDVLHGVAFEDPYRWLEDQDSSATRKWIQEQTRYARAYLEGIPGRQQIRMRIRELLAVETCDSLLVAGGKYFFRKRRASEEQPCIYMREGADGEDHLLVDSQERDLGKHTAVRPLQGSPDGRLLLYEVKEGGERTGTYELLEVDSRKRLPDLLPRGYLRGFVFAPDSRSFYYVHVPAKRDPSGTWPSAAYQHTLGTPFSEDREIFAADGDLRTRVGLLPGEKRFGIMVQRFGPTGSAIDVYLHGFEQDDTPRRILNNVEYRLGLHLAGDRIFGITDLNAPNQRIVEIHLKENGNHEWTDVVPETDARIADWVITRELALVVYLKGATHRIFVHDLAGARVEEIPVSPAESVHVFGGSGSDDVLFETESFTKPIDIWRYDRRHKERRLWSRRNVPFDGSRYDYRQVQCKSKDGTEIPMFLAGRKDVLVRDSNPTIMTSYGGYGVPMTPQFSVFVAFLMERGCLFALPNIRGGSEFGVEWHEAAKRRNRQTAYDDFLAAAEWLINTGRTAPGRLGIFGGSNSGLLVGAALTQRPDLFRAAVCMVPILDMLRYHLFDGAEAWKEEFGTADDPDDFVALASYSPYHRVRDGVAYPATLFVSGDRDGTCNPLHARKMTARLQAATSSDRPILLDYSEFRGHSPVLPLSDRVDALTDRMAFLCNQLELPVEAEGACGSLS